jgi:hypothetical protein
VPVGDGVPVPLELVLGDGDGDGDGELEVDPVGEALGDVAGLDDVASPEPGLQLAGDVGPVEPEPPGTTPGGLPPCE